MATNLALDPDLLQRAFEASGLPTKKAAVTLALEEFVQRRNQQRLLELIGAGDPDDVWMYDRMPERGIRVLEAGAR